MDSSRENRSKLKEQATALSNVSRKSSISAVSALSDVANVEENTAEPNRTSRISVDTEGLQQVLDNLYQQQEPINLLRTTGSNDFAPLQPVGIGDSNSTRSLQGQGNGPRREAGMEHGLEFPSAIQRKPVPVRALPQETITSLSNLYDHDIRPVEEEEHPDPEVHTPQAQISPDESLGKETFVESTGMELREIPKMWNPIWLQYPVLVALIATFSLMGIALGLLYRFSEMHNGISTQITTNHYSWTYGPTAVLVLISVFWHQVEYFCMILTPWKRLRLGFAGPDTTLLLDYVSMNIFVAPFTAGKYGDWAVAAAISGSQILRLVTIFSTGLLVLEPFAVREEGFPLKTTSAFSGEIYRNFSIDFNTQSRYEFDQPVKKYFGALTFGMPLPEGTVDGVSFQTFEAAKSYPSNSIILADVLGIWPSFGCEIPKIQYTLPPSDYEGFINATMPAGGFVPVWPIKLTTSRCSTIITQIGNTNPYTRLVKWCNPRFQVCPTTRQVSFDHQNIDCNAINNTSPTGKEEMWAVTLTSAKFDQVLPSGADNTVGAPANATSWNTSLNVSVVVCMPTYSMKKTQIKVDTSKNGTGFENEVLGGKIENGLPLLPEYLYEGVDMTLRSWFSDIFGSYALGMFNSDVSSGELLGVLMKKDNNDSDLLAFLDGQTLLDTATGVYERLAAIVISNSTRVAANESFSGTLEYTDSRLVVQKTAVIAMSVGMGLLVVATLIILLFRPYDEVPLAPNSIGSLAILLSSSIHLLDVLKTAGQSRMSALRGLLGAYRYRTTTTITLPNTQPRFVIELLAGENHFNTKPRSPGVKWWRPFPVKIWFIMTLSALIIGIIVALEIIQRKSDSNDGFASVNGSVPLARRLASYITAAVMLLLSILVDRLATVCTTIAPFQALKNRQAGSRVIMTDYPSQWILQKVWTSLCIAQYGVTLTATASFLTSFLAIIVSGLYLVQSTPTSHQVDIPRTDQWTIKATYAGGGIGDTATDNFAAGAFQLIEFSNLTFPQFTFDQVAFPQVSAPDNVDSLQLSSATSMAVGMTGLRAKLTCYDITRSSTQFNFSAEPDSRGSGLDSVTRSGDYSTFKVLQVHESFNRNPLFSCTNSQGQNASSISYNVNIPPADPYRPKYFGLFSDPSTLIIDDIIPTGILGLSLRPQDNCPILAFTFGRWATQSINSTTVPEYTHLLCSQSLERVHSEVTFLLPSLDIDTIHKPTIKSEEPPFISRSEYNLWNPAVGLHSEEYGPPDYTNKSDEAYDRFFRGMFYGSGRNIPSRDQLLGSNTTTKFFSTIETYYKRYMAQVINAKFRIPGHDPAALTYKSANWSSINAPLTFKAKVHVPDERILQNNVSKIILQVLLGLILVLTVCGWLLMDKGNVLTHDPNSIAGLGSWIAGGGLADMEGLGLEQDWMSRGDFCAEKVFEDRVYSLGWWPAGAGVASGVIKDAKSPESEPERERFGIDLGRARRPS